MLTDLLMTPHAETRAQKRVIDNDAIALILAYGEEIEQGADRIAYFIGDAQIAQHAEEVDLSRLRNMAVVLAEDSVVVTVIRTNGCRRLRKFSTYKNRRPRG